MIHDNTVPRRRNESLPVLLAMNLRTIKIINAETRFILGGRKKIEGSFLINVTVSSVISDGSLNEKILTLYIKGFDDIPITRYLSPTSEKTAEGTMKQSHGVSTERKRQPSSPQVSYMAPLKQNVFGNYNCVTFCAQI